MRRRMGNAIFGHSVSTLNVFSHMTPNRQPSPYPGAPNGLADITRIERDFARELIHILNSHGVSYQKIRRCRPSTLNQTKPLDALLGCLDPAIPANALKDGALAKALEPLLQAFDLKDVLQHSIWKFNNGHYFAQHLPKSPRQQNPYPAGVFARVKATVGVFDDAPVPAITVVKIHRENLSAHPSRSTVPIKTQQASIQAEHDALSRLGKLLDHFERPQTSRQPKRDYIHQIRAEGHTLYQITEENALRGSTNDLRNPNAFENTPLAQEPGDSRAHFYENFLLSGLAELIVQHRRGVLHLDIKPSNIIVTSTGIAQLIDFGASIPEPSPSQTIHRNLLSRTPQYATNPFLLDCAHAQRQGGTPNELKTTLNEDIVAFALCFAHAVGLYDLQSSVHSHEQDIALRNQLPTRLQSLIGKGLSQTLCNAVNLALSYRFAANWVDDPLANIVKTLSPEENTRLQGFIQAAEQPTARPSTYQAAERKALEMPYREYQQRRLNDPTHQAYQVARKSRASARRNARAGSFGGLGRLLQAVVGVIWYVISLQWLRCSPKPKTASQPSVPRQPSQKFTPPAEFQDRKSRLSIVVPSQIPTIAVVEASPRPSRT